MQSRCRRGATICCIIILMVTPRLSAWAPADSEAQVHFPDTLRRQMKELSERIEQEGALIGASAIGTARSVAREEFGWLFGYDTTHMPPEAVKLIEYIKTQPEEYSS